MSQVSQLSPVLANGLLQLFGSRRLNLCTMIVVTGLLLPPGTPLRLMTYLDGR